MVMNVEETKAMRAYSFLVIIHRREGSVAKKVSALDFKARFNELKAKGLAPIKNLPQVLINYVLETEDIFGSPDTMECIEVLPLKGNLYGIETQSP